MKGITNRQVYIHLFIANIITQFLFFIDEGYYDFRWMKLWGNWVVYVIYVLGIWLLSLGLRWFVHLIVATAKRLFAKP